MYRKLKVFAKYILAFEKNLKIIICLCQIVRKKLHKIRQRHRAKKELKLLMIALKIHKEKSVQICKIFLANVLCLSVLHAVFTGTSWRDLKPKDVDKKVDGSGTLIRGREITLTEETILNLTTAKNPVLEEQYYTGDLRFEDVRLLTLNIDVAAAGSGDLTPIYWRKKTDSKVINSFTCGKYQDSDGTCTMNLNINSTKVTLKHLVEMEASTIIFSPNINVSFAQNSKVHSLFVAGLHGSKDAEGTIEFFAGLKVDLRDTQGEFSAPQIGEKRRLIFENYGAAINVNPDRRFFAVQLYGDIYTEGLGTRINLVTPDSIFQGHIDIGNASFNSFTAFTLQNGATADIKLSYLTPQNANIQNFSLFLQDSTAKLDATLAETQNAQSIFTLNDSTLYANFTYTALNRGNQDKMSIELNQSRWITNKSAYADEVRFGNGGVIDLRFRDFEGNVREYPKMTDTNRLKITSKSISGGGTFRLYGILNRALWEKDAQGNSIATDQVITDSVQGNQAIELYWDPKNLDESLLSEELLGDRIVVAKQLSRKNEGEFVGVSTPIGLFEYTTTLTKEDLFDNAGNAVGYEWVIGKFLKGALAPQTQTPSFLSKTLNSSLSIPYKTWLLQTQTLHERMGDLRGVNNIAGAYIKTAYSLIHSQESSKEISSLTHGFEVSLGGDYSYFTYGGKNFLGLALSVMPIWDVGDGGAYASSGMAYGFSVYDTFLFDNGLYMDLLLKYIYGSHKYDFYSEDLLANSLSFDTHAVLASYEMGYFKNFSLANIQNFYLKPQLNLNFGYLFGQKGLSLNHALGYAVDAEIVGSFPLQTACSLDFGKRFESENLNADVFVSVGGEYAFNAGNTLKLYTPINEGEFVPENIFNLKLAVGGNVIFSKARMYFEMSSRFVGRIAPVLSLTAGARIPLGNPYPRLSSPKIHFPVIYGSRRRD